MYRVKDFLKYVYPLVGQLGGTIAITDDHFLYAVNWGMNQLRAYGGYKWDWQRWKDSRNNIDNGSGILKIQTTHPILEVGNFYCGAMNPLEIVDYCGCTPVSEDYTVPCPCSCEGGNLLKLRKKQPMEELNQGEYNIVRSSGVHPSTGLGCKSCKDISSIVCSVSGVGGPGGNLIHLKLPTGCGVSNNCDEGVWVTYRRAPQHTFNFNDVILVPDLFVVPLAYFVAAYLMPAFGQGRAGDDISFIQLARQEIDSLVKHFSILPDKIVPSGETTPNPETMKPSYMYSYMNG